MRKNSRKVKMFNPQQGIQLQMSMVGRSNSCLHKPNIKNILYATRIGWTYEVN